MAADSEATVIPTAATATAAAAASPVGREGKGASFFPLVEPDNATLGVPPRVAPPRTEGFVPPFAGEGVGVRALDREAAVGLLSRSATALLNVVFFVGVGGKGGAFLDFAKDAAVGANRPEGVFGRLAVVGAGTGDLALVAEAGAREGVFERKGVVGVGFVIGFRADADDAVCCGLNGWAPGVCFGGVFIAGLREALGVVGTGVLPGDFNVLEVGVASGFGASADIPGSNGKGAFVVSRSTREVGSVLRGLESTSVDSDFGGMGCWVLASARRLQEDDGMIGDAFSLLEVDFGGHSRFSLTSSFEESLVMFDITLVLRGDAVGGGNDWRFV